MIGDHERDRCSGHGRERRAQERPRPAQQRRRRRPLPRRCDAAAREGEVQRARLTGTAAAASTRTSHRSAVSLAKCRHNTNPSAANSPSAFQYVSGKLRRLFATSGEVGHTLGSSRVISANAHIVTIAAVSVRSSKASRRPRCGTEPKRSVASKYKSGRSNSTSATPGRATSPARARFRARATPSPREQSQAPTDSVERVLGESRAASGARTQMRPQMLAPWEKSAGVESEIPHETAGSGIKAQRASAYARRSVGKTVPAHPYFGASRPAPSRGRGVSTTSSSERD